MAHLRSTFPYIVVVLLLSALPALSGCEVTEEEKIHGLLGRLEKAINRQDTLAASECYMGKITAVNGVSDTNVIYQMLRLKGANDFSIDNDTIAVIGENALATFDLSGNMHHADTLAGRMSIRLSLELEELNGEWKIVPGTESRE